VLGTLDREPVAAQQAAELVGAKTDAGGLGQMGGQSRHRPSREAVPQSQRIGQYRLAHLLDKLGRGPSRPARRLDRLQGVDAALAVQATHPRDRVGRASQIFGDRGNGVARVGLENDQTVAKNVGGLGGEANAIQFVPLLVRELDTPTHDALLAAPPPEKAVSSLEKLNGSIFVPT
jgi:hypothetical protein